MVKLLKDHGQRVNYSVFECDVKKNAFVKLQTDAQKIINRKEDSVLFYALCNQCLESRCPLGVKKFEEIQGVLSVWRSCNVLGREQKSDGVNSLLSQANFYKAFEGDFFQFIGVDSIRADLLCSLSPYQ